MATLGVGGCLGAGIAIPALRVLASPVGRRVVTSPGDPIDVGSVDQLSRDGSPIKLGVVAPMIRDAWSSVQHIPLGAAWIRRDGDRIFALSSICPHLGCAIAWSPAHKQFECPCHDSAFAVSGARIKGPAKRGLDELPVTEIGGRLKLNWLRYRPGIADKVEV